MSRGLLKKRVNDLRSKEVDVWNDEKSLLQDNIREVLDKFDTIDPEIWGKIIYMEKNRRLGKAFARSSSTSGANSVIKVTDSSIGFDGLTIGLKGFNSCDSDQLITEALSHLDKGIEIIMEDCGNIVVHNQTESRIFIRSYNLIKPEHKRFDGLGTIRLLPGRRETLFDINCYLDSIESCIHNQIKITKQQNRKPTTMIKDDNNNLTVNCDKHSDDMSSTRRKLELQTISLISLGRETYDLLETPCYLIIINIVALDILRAKLPSKYQRKFNSINRRNRRQPRGSILNLLSHLTPSKRNLTTINSPSSTSSSSPSLTLFSSLSSSSTSSASSSVSSCSSISSDYPSQLSSSMQTINLVNDCSSNVNHSLHPNPNHHRNHSNSNINNYQSSSSARRNNEANNNLTDNLHLSSMVPNHYQSSTTIKDSTWYTTNQLQSANRSHSWSILTTSTCNHYNSDQHQQHRQQPQPQPQQQQQHRPPIIPSIKLPEPDYDDNNNSNQMDNQLPWYQDNQIHYNSLKKLSNHNRDQMNATDTSPMMISSRSRSYHDILTPSNDNFWLQLNGDQHSS